jgi:hypothetical protein
MKWEDFLVGVFFKLNKKLDFPHWRGMKREDFFAFLQAF